MQVLQIYRKENLKLNKDKSHFRCIQLPFSGEIIFWQGVRPDPSKLKILTDIIPLMTKNELQALLCTLNYLSKFSLVTTKAWKPLRQLTSVRTECTWNEIYQKLFDKANAIIKQAACMKFYDKKDLCT